ncbi:MAG: hypothetical protein ABI811_02200 [Acidobacteriota bacterium]
MLILPLEKKTFTRDFLNGKGTLEFDLDAGGVLNPDAPFADSISLVRIGGSGIPSLEFGDAAGLACRVPFSSSAESGIELSRPDKVGMGKLGARLYFTGSASGNLKGLMPAGPAGFSFGIEAGGGVGYQRFAIYDAAQNAGAIIADLLAGLRLPQHCGRLDRIPEPGEILTFQYSGFLALNAGLTWGYQLTGHQGMDYRELHPVADYELRLKAAVSFGYRLGGEFSIQASRGHSANFVRLTVRKQQDARFDGAASFNLDAAAKFTGVPESADEFLRAVAGADLLGALELFRKIRNVSDLKTLEEVAGKLYVGTLQELAQTWIGKALDNNSVGEFIGIANRAAADYENLDASVSKRVTQAIHLYEDYLGQGTLPLLERALEMVTGLDSRQSLVNLSDSEAWSIVDRLAGGDVLSASMPDLAKTASVALDFLRGKLQPRLLDVIGVLQKSSALNEAAAFKDVWYKRITEAANRSFSLQVNAAFARASHAEALLDVEIDLASQRGPELFAAAAHGNFAGLFQRANLPFLVVHQGVLTHSLTKSCQLNISVFGWQQKSLVEIMSKTENLIQAGPAGGIQIFTTEAAVKQRRETKGRDKTTEIVESNFLMRFAGEAELGANTIRELQRVSAEYDLLASDDHTTTEEMADYLALAEMVGLIPSADAYALEWKAQFPAGFGKVTARYVVAFTAESVRDAFTLPVTEMAEIARTVTRQLVRAQLVSGRPVTDDLTLIGLVYLDPEMQRRYDTQGFTAIEKKAWTVRMPGGSRTLKPELSIFVTRLLKMERDVVVSLSNLSRVINKAREVGTAVPEQALENAARKFVECAVDLDGGTGRINSFFAVFDALIAAGSRREVCRDSSMILEIQAGDKSRKVTKYLTSAPAAKES